MEIYWLACRSQRPECCGSSIVSRENGCKAPTDLDGTHGAWWVHSSQIWVDLGDIWVVYIRLWICWSAYRCKQYMNHQMVFRQLNHQQFDACIGWRWRRDMEYHVMRFLYMPTTSQMFGHREKWYCCGSVGCIKTLKDSSGERKGRQRRPCVAWRRRMVECLNRSVDRNESSRWIHIWSNAHHVPHMETWVCVIISVPWSLRVYELRYDIWKR